MIKLHIIVDRSSIELFANDGTVMMTDRIFTTNSRRHVEIFADGGRVQLDSGEIRTI